MLKLTASQYDLCADSLNTGTRSQNAVKALWSSASLLGVPDGLSSCRLGLISRSARHLCRVFAPRSLVDYILMLASVENPKLCSGSWGIEKGARTGSWKDRRSNR